MTSSGHPFKPYLTNVEKVYRRNVLKQETTFKCHNVAKIIYLRMSKVTTALAPNVERAHKYIARGANVERR